MRLVPIECVREGCYLGRTIYDSDGRILLRAGVKLSTSLIKRIKAVNIYSLYVTDDQTQKEIDEVISPELKQKSILLLKDVFTTFDKISNDSTITNNSKKKFKLLEEKEKYLNSLEELSEELYENIISNKKLMIGLVDIKTMDAYTYQHSLNVAVISIVMGVGFKLPKRKLLDLCMGALLHDIGKIFIGKDIIQKPSRLTDAEFEAIKNHPKAGYDYLHKNDSISTSSKIVILQHHEKIDGSGYPKGLLGNDINLLAKIVAVADVYDALTSDRPYKLAMCPNEAFEFILSKADSMFDFEVTQIFSKVLVPYAKDSHVKLSNGDVAKVKKLHQFYPLRPYLEIIDSLEKSKIGTYLDLSKELSIVISSMHF
ncbi:MAG: HD-GYP domain-containing protein [Sarcina sp.]